MERQQRHLLSPACTAVVILNFQGEEDTLACLHALAALPHPPGRVMIADNNSGGDSLAALRAGVAAQGMPGVRLLPLPRNNGYASGNNAGLRLALADPAMRAFWILNNDTLPQPNALQALCDCLNARPGAAMAGSTLVYAHAPDIVQCAGGYRLNKLLGTTAPLHGERPLPEIMALDPALISQQLDYISGASLLIRREALETLGLLAEEYFLYYEDAEFGLRAKKRGHELAWAKDSIVLHKEGGSSKAASAIGDRRFTRPAYVDFLSLRNRIYLMRGHYPWSLPTVLAGSFAALLRRVARGQARRIPLLLKAVFHGLGGRMGKPEWLFQKPPKPSAPAILFITARADFGGGPEHLFQLLKHRPPAVRCLVACPEDYPYFRRFCELLGGENVFVIPHRGFSLASLLRLRAFRARRKAKLIHSHGKGAGLYARPLALLSCVPCVHTFHGVHMDAYGPLKKLAYRLYERCMSLLTRKGVAVSASERERILAEGLMPAGKLALIPNGVAIPDAPAAPPVAPPYEVVSISRFDFAKNSGFVLDILQELRKRGRLDAFHFTIIGNGPDRPALREKAAGLGLSGHLALPGASPEPQNFFNNALCCLSTSRWEGMPLAVLEAMAHGLPAAVSDVTGNRDAVTHGKTGLLYPEGDAVAATNALCRLTDEPELRRELGRQAREETSQKYDVRQMAERTYKVLLGEMKDTMPPAARGVTPLDPHRGG